MPASTRTLALSAFLGAALAAAQAPAQTNPMPMPEKKDQTAGDKKDDPADLKKTVADLKTDVESLRKSRDSVDDLLYGKADGKTALDLGIMRRLSDLDARLKAVESALARIEAALKDPSRTSAYPPGTGPAPIANRSMIRIINDYPTEMSMMVNGKSYRVAPGEVRVVDVPAGNYTYELLHAGSQPKSAAIKDGETVTLRIN